MTLAHIQVFDRHMGARPENLYFSGQRPGTSARGMRPLRRNQPVALGPVPRAKRREWLDMGAPPGAAPRARAGYWPPGPEVPCKVAVASVVDAAACNAATTLATPGELVVPDPEAPETFSVAVERA